MKRLVAWTALVFIGWLTVSVAWATAARLTGMPGPASAAEASVETAADAVESVDLPAPLSVSQRTLTRRMRAGGRALARLYSVPERIAARLADARRGHRVDIERVTERLLDRDRRVRIEGAGERMNRVRQRVERVHERLDRTRERLERVRERIESRVIQVTPGG